MRYSRTRKFDSRIQISDMQKKILDFQVLTPSEAFVYPQIKFDSCENGDKTTRLKIHAVLGIYLILLSTQFGVGYVSWLC